MGFMFRPAVRENVPLLIGLIGPSGSGKTFTAMRLAMGMAGDKRFAVIDTEAGRAKHYADQFAFDHGDMVAPFRPSAYLEAIEAADKAGYPVIVVDSVSHEHAGSGGLIDWQEEELEKMAGSDWKKRERCKMSAWIKPKTAHKRMVQRLLQVRAHLILCFRAEEKVKMVKNKGKTEIVDAGWQPICEKNFPYELTVSFLLSPDAPGVPLPIKLQEQHKPLFPLGKCITEKAGSEIAAWAAGGVEPKKTATAKAISNDVTQTQRDSIRQLCKDNMLSGEETKQFCISVLGESPTRKDVEAVLENFDDHMKSWQESYVPTEQPES